MCYQNWRLKPLRFNESDTEFRRYATGSHAEEPRAKIERTDDLVDRIVFERYGLTDEEIEIVEDAVSE